ncbi:hypothetical protein BU16DRAFT_185878 [Lophium mytilinum]|uniref:Uncharacterized protein n=1 Tax=Lophium mytilinum TaxID=390894 RepID=A0A6A6R8Q8_9PEZI|nr:hypothetical protein BU16DRAFT_185878 [Lophium mytilinum]
MSSSTLPIPRRTKETDTILLAAKSVLKKLRQDSIAAFLAHIEIRKTTPDESRRLPALRKDDGENAGYYTIVESTQPGLLSRTLAIRWENGSLYKRRFNKLPDCFVAGNRLEVKIRRVWINFQEWVQTLHRDAEQYVGDVGFRKQAQWWASNGKQFRVMELPKELRLAVFGQAIGMDLFPETYSRATEESDETCVASLGHGYTPPEEWEGTVRRGDIVDAPNFALLRVSKQVYEECKDAAFLGRVSFADQRHADILPLLKAPEVPIPNVLTHIGLSLSLMEYIYFFGVRVQPWLDEGRITSPPPAQEFFCNVPTLQRLGIKFPSPMYGQFTDPWCIDRCEKNYRGPEGELPMGCHNTVVDWIMIFATQYVGHIPKVYLEGYVKNSIQAKWRGIFDSQNSGTEIDLRNEMTAIELIPFEDLPPKCDCAYPCDNRDIWLITHPLDTCDHGPGSQCKCVWRIGHQEQRQQPKRVLKRYKFHFEDERSSDSSGDDDASQHRSTLR